MTILILRLQGSVVVTGGLGMIGSILGAWLTRQGIEHVVLLGRSGRPATDSKSVQEFLGSGCSAAISIQRCDAASVDEVQAVAGSLTASRYTIEVTQICSLFKTNVLTY